MTTQFIVNHLWQSSCFALLAGLLAFVLRKHSPKIRYWVWLSASLKFLLPFALLVSLGSVVPRPMTHPVSVASPVFPDTLVQIAEPFSPALKATVPAQAPLNWAPIVLGVPWALGFLAITLARCRSWLRVRVALRAGTPIELPIPVRALITPGAEEPGIVGFLRPVLVLPAQLLEHLNPRQLGAILTHEMGHVRRWDNFFAAVHMVVEAIFWFHPLVWWIGSRMVEERELACDEEVLRMGCEPADYVQGILKVCRFYTESLSPCISGVTGADIKKRLRAILAGGIAPELSGGKKLTLATIGLAALAVPIAVGIVNAPLVRAQSSAAQKQLTFDAASVKPATVPAGVTVTPGGGMVVRRESGIAIPRNAGGPGTDNPGRIHYPLISLKNLLHEAYNSYFEITGPAWLDDDFMQVDATMPPDTTKAQFQKMLQNLLIDRFALKTHVDTKEITGYALAVTKDGPKFKVSQPDNEPEGANTHEIGPDGWPVPRAHMKGSGFQSMPNERIRLLSPHATMAELAKALGKLVDSTVEDATGLKEEYNITLTFAGHFGGRGPVTALLEPLPPSTDPSVPEPLPDIFSALPSELGLRLEKRKVSVEIVVIDHLEKLPIAN